jgi:aspartyl-tRNA(Asn)/glutamyl-tRNA(Gln) amidotransferase subunit A
MAYDQPLTLRDAGLALRSRAITSREMVTAALSRADDIDRFLGVYITRFDDYALEQADRADAAFSAGYDCGPLQGITFGVKDLLRMAEGPTTAQSTVLSPAWGRGPDAVVVTSLKDAKAVITGKVTLSEFAIGSPDLSKPFPVPRNPWDLLTWPGGSSAGTAVGIAAGLFLAGIGSDSGGSIRLPAAFCGITGFKPTYGLVPTGGCIPLGFTMDTLGPMARSAEDCALVLDSIADPLMARHGSGRRLTQSNANTGRPLAGVRIAIVRAEHFVEGAVQSAESAFDDMVAVSKSLGAQVSEIQLPLFDAARAAGMIINQAEGFAYHRSALLSRWPDYCASSRKRLSVGALTSGADYVQAQRVRRSTQRELAQLFETVDIVMTPTATVGAPPYDTDLKIDFHSLFRTAHTNYWNCAGLPALAMPMGFTDNGMPLSVQLAGAAFEDRFLLGVGRSLQQVTDWHLQMPPNPTPSLQEPSTASADRRDGSGSETDEKTVRALLAVAGVPATEQEIAELSAGYSSQRAAIDSLYGVLECLDDSPPAVKFAADLWD